MDRGPGRARCSNYLSPLCRRPSPAAPQQHPRGHPQTRGGAASVRPAARASIAVSTALRHLPEALQPAHTSALRVSRSSPVPASLHSPASHQDPVSRGPRCPGAPPPLRPPAAAASTRRRRRPLTRTRVRLSSRARVTARYSLLCRSEPLARCSACPSIRRSQSSPCHHPHTAPRPPPQSLSVPVYPTASAANEPTRCEHSRGEAVGAQGTEGAPTRTLGAAAEPDPQGTPEGYSGWMMEGTIFSTPS
jgi:hypothetical protein